MSVLFNKFIIIFVTLLLPILTITESKDMDAKQFSSAVANFSAKFCDELPKDKSVVSSPLSAEVLLGLLTLGTTDPSHSELLAALGVQNDDMVRKLFSSVSASLKSTKGITLNVANKMYIMEGSHNLNSSLKNDAVKIFDAELEKADFAKSDEAAKLINQWVEKKTNNKIKDLISSDSLDNSTRLVLVNAIYFKGDWKIKFDPEFTKDRTFYINNKATVEVPMMYLKDDFKLGMSEELDSKILEMKYVGNEASMVIVLPNEIEGLNAVLRKLANGYNLMEDITNLRSTKVEVTIPKFRIETEIDLTQLLPKLGIKAIFDTENSGITKMMSNDEQLVVTKAIQKAFIEVNEAGAEAAAATAMAVMLCSAMVDFNPVQKFVADHPFLALIVIDNISYFWSAHRGQ